MVSKYGSPWRHDPNGNKSTVRQAKTQAHGAACSEERAAVTVVEVNELPAALRRKRKRQSAILMSKPFAEPPFWLAVSDECPAKMPALDSDPIEPSPFAFAAEPRRRKRRKIVRFLRTAIPALVCVASVATVISVAVWAMHRPALAHERGPAIKQPEAVASRALAIPESPPPANPPVAASHRPVTPIAATVKGKPQNEEVPVTVTAPADDPGVAGPIRTRVAQPPAAEPAPVIGANIAACEACDAKVNNEAPVCIECQKQAAMPEGTASYGTQVTFVDDPVVAAKQAKEQNKLMFMMTISGNFEESRFT